MITTRIQIFFLRIVIITLFQFSSPDGDNQTNHHTMPKLTFLAYHYIAKPAKPAKPSQTFLPNISPKHSCLTSLLTTRPTKLSSSLGFQNTHILYNTYLMPSTCHLNPPRNTFSLLELLRQCRLILYDAKDALLPGSIPLLPRDCSTHDS